MKPIKFFIFGILAALGAIATELVLSALFSILLNVDIGKNYSDTITFFLFLVIAIEEIFKLSLLAKLFSDLEKTASKISLALFLGGGFALVEISSKVFFLPPDALTLALFSSLFGVFVIHVLTAGVLGYFLAKKDLPSFSLIAAAFLLAFLLHLIYNLFIIYDQSAWFIGFYLISVSAVLYLLKNKLAR